MNIKMSGSKLNFLIFTVLCTVNLVVCDFNLVLLHNNDMASHFEETSVTTGVCQDTGACYGGFARIKTLVDQIRTEKKGKSTVLFLNAGNTFHGTHYYSFFKWPVVASLIGQIGIDVMSLGIHEFDDGVKGLAPYLKNISIKTVAANIDVTNEPSLQTSNLVPYVVRSYKGTMVAIIGYVTPQAKVLTHTGKVQFNDEIASIKRVIKSLKKKGIKIFIALGSSGFKRDLEIAKNIPDIDLVVGGFSNTFLYNGDQPNIETVDGEYPTIVKQKTGRKVPVVQTFGYTKYLGYLELVFDNHGELKSYNGNPNILDSSVTPNEKVLSVLQPWKEKVDNATGAVIGETKVTLDANDRVCKLHECNVGNLIADAFIDANARTYTGKKGWTDAPIAIVQAGGIQSTIEYSEANGTITYADILHVLPSEEPLVKGKISGEALLEVLEHAVHRIEQTALENVGEFLQVSGLRVNYDIANQAESRVSSAQVRCGDCNVPAFTDIVANQTYGIVLTTYLANGGDGYEIFLTELKNRTSIDSTDTEALANYIKAKSPIYPVVTNRLKVYGQSEVTTKAPVVDPTKKPGAASSIEYYTSLLVFAVISLIRLQNFF